MRHENDSHYTIKHKRDGRTEEQVTADWEAGNSRCIHCCDLPVDEWDVICDCLLFHVWDEQTIQIASFGRKNA